MDRRVFLKTAASAAMVAASPCESFASAWPKDRPIRAVVPFSPGASIDIIGRICADAVSRRIGQTIVVMNRGGAGGTLGADYVAKSDPDGYTLLIQASNQTIAPAIYKHLPYDTLKDFSGVAIFGTVPNVLLVSPRSGYKSVQELVAKAKTKDIFFSSSGVGSASHWAAERFRISAGFKATHVPMKSGLEALTEVIANRIDFCCIGTSAAMAFIQGKQVDALCVTADTRSASLPDVPTSVELGYKDSVYNFWNGALLPAKTPRAIVDRLYKEITASLADPEVKRKLVAQGVEPSPVTPTEFDAQMRREVEENKKIARAAGLQLR